MIDLYTIPHTGTRFVIEVLGLNGIWPIPQKVKHAVHGIRYTHCRVPNGWPEPRQDVKYITTVRDPIDTFLTWRRNIGHFENFEARFFATWAHYFWRLKGKETFYVALDCPAEERADMLTQLVAYCNFDPNEKVIKDFSDSWPHVGSTKKSEEQSEDVDKRYFVALKEWYEHYTHDWGVHGARRDKDVNSEERRIIQSANG